MGIAVRVAEAGDEAAIARIAQEAPDGGAVSFSVEHHVDVHDGHIGSHERVVTVVAEAGDPAQVVGSARVSFGTCLVAGRSTSYALLGGLTVAADQRRRGVATALAAWRVRHAIEAVGADALVLANVQTGNIGSTAVAGTWATQRAGRMVAIPVPMRRRAPRPRPDLEVRPVRLDDLEEVAALGTDSGRTFARLWTAGRLRSWLDASPFPDPVNHYLVVTNRSGRLLAGMAVREEGRIRSLVVQRAPVLIRLANLALHVIPPDGRMRNLVVDRVWSRPGHLDAAQFLWQHTRWEWRERGSTLLTTHDPRGPVHQVVRPPAWLPTTSATVMVRSTRPIDPAAVIDPLL